MDVHAFALLLVIGAALLAVWLDFRLGERRPASAVRRFCHVAAAYVVLQIVTVAFEHVAKATATPGQRIVALFLLFLPSLLYAFLSGLWLFRTLADATRLARR